MPDLLIELFSEDLPARMQSTAAETLRRLITEGLVEAGLTYASAGAFATPRRLTLMVEGLPPTSPDVREDRRGPRVGAPDQALAGFLRSTGLRQDQLQVRPDKKGDVYVAVIERPGRPAADIVADVTAQVIRTFPWPKSMRWGAGSLRWARPLRSILCILSDEAGTHTVPFTVDGITAGDTTEGHRFMAPGRFAVLNFADYQTKLAAAHVVLSADDRAARIWQDATTLAFAQGLQVVEDQALLAEVAGLVEWPEVLMGTIGAEFLDLPAEVLQTSMREHQKFFSVKNPATGRIEKFITVANLTTADGGQTILAGNQKVLAARLSDAVFFWENDLRVARAGMGDWMAALENVTFERRLGSQADRIARIAELARQIAPMVGADAEAAATAARVAKADLSSGMVYEFPELQGTMGTYYAHAAGHAAGIAAVCAEHYQPLGPSDAVPTNPLSVAVALADKIDTLTGFWAIDEKPTGSKDPFALRRAALGVIRIVLENDLRIKLTSIFSVQAKALHDSQVQLYFNRLSADSKEYDEFFRGMVGVTGEMLQDKALLKELEMFHSEYNSPGEDSYKTEIWQKAKKFIFDKKNMKKGSEDSIAENLLAFFHDRLKVHLRGEGIAHDVIDAVLAKPPTDDLARVAARARALQAFLKTPDGENLVQGYRRAANILAQAEAQDGVDYRMADEKYAQMDEERALFSALSTARLAIAPALRAEDFTLAMKEMAKLRAPIDAFFEAVQVNTDHQIVRRNRLGLLHHIVETCGQVADLSRLEG